MYKDPLKFTEEMFDETVKAIKKNNQELAMKWYNKMLRRLEILTELVKEESSDSLHAKIDEKIKKLSLNCIKYLENKIPEAQKMFKKKNWKYYEISK